MLSLPIFFSSYRISAQNRQNVYYINETRTIDTTKFLKADDAIYIIQAEVDLHENKIEIGENCTIIFDEKGVLYNGTLKGNNTKVVGNGAIFSNISIVGTWKVPYITTGMFKDLQYDNSLRDVIALTNPVIYNKVIIEDGEYWLSTTDSKLSGIELASNTDIIISGQLRLRPNREKRSYIISIIDCQNVSVSGSGSIEGDRVNHYGTEGEWGMGVAVFSSTNVNIQDISVSNCWGDCIYIAKKSKDIFVNNLSLSNSRRQGVSIVGCDGCNIRNCTITNVGGKLPEYGIDLEPNANQSVRNIIIENNRIVGCQGGILVCGTAQNAVVEKIRIVNNIILLSENATHHSFAAYDCNDIVLDGNSLLSRSRNCLKITNSNNIIFNNNNIESFSGNYIEECSNISFNSCSIKSNSYLFKDVSGLILINNRLECSALMLQNKEVNGLLLNSNVISGTIPNQYLNSIITNNILKKKYVDTAFLKNKKKKNNIISNNKIQ